MVIVVIIIKINVYVLKLIHMLNIIFMGIVIMVMVNVELIMIT